MSSHFQRHCERDSRIISTLIARVLDPFQSFFVLLERRAGTVLEARELQRAGSASVPGRHPKCLRLEVVSALGSPQFGRTSNVLSGFGVVMRAIRTARAAASSPASIASEGAAYHALSGR